MPATTHDAAAADVAPCRNLTAAASSRRPPALPPLPGGRAGRPRLPAACSNLPQGSRRARRRTAAAFAGPGRSAYSSSDDEQLNAAAGAGVQRAATAVASPPPAPSAKVASARAELQRFRPLDEAWIEDVVGGQLVGDTVASGAHAGGAPEVAVERGAVPEPSRGAPRTQDLPPWLTPAFLTGLTAVAHQQQQQTLGGGGAGGQQLQPLFGRDVGNTVLSAGNALPSVQAAFHGAEAARLAALERNLGMFESQLAAKEQALKALMADIHTVEAARASTAAAHEAAQLEAQQAATRHVSASVTAYAARAAADAALLDVLGDDAAPASATDDADSDVFHHELLLADAVLAEQAAARQAAESAAAARQAASLAAEATRLADALAAAAAQEEARALWREARAAAMEEMVSDAAVFASDADDMPSDGAASWSDENGTQEQAVEEELEEQDLASAESASRWLSRLDGAEDIGGSGDEAAHSDIPLVAAVEGDALDDALLGLAPGGGDDVAAEDDVDGELWEASTQAEVTFVLDFPPEGAPSPGPLFSASAPGVAEAAAPEVLAPPASPVRSADASPAASPPVSPTQQHSAVAVVATVAALSAALVAAPMVVLPELSATLLGSATPPAIQLAQRSAPETGASLQAVFDAARVAGDGAYQAALARLGLAAKPTTQVTFPPEAPPPIPAASFVDVPIVAMPPPPPPPSAPPVRFGPPEGPPGGGDVAVGAASSATPAGSAAASLLASLAAQPQALGGSLVTLALAGLGAAATRRVQQDEQAKAAAAAEAAAREQAALARRSSISRLGFSAVAAGLVAASTVAWVQLPSVPGIDMLHLPPAMDPPAVSFASLPPGDGDIIDVEATVTSMDNTSSSIAAALVTVPPPAPPLVEAAPTPEPATRKPTAAPRLSALDALFSALLATGALTCASVTVRLLREAESRDASNDTDAQQLARTEAEFKRRFVAARASLLPLPARPATALPAARDDGPAQSASPADVAQVLVDAVSMEAEEEAAAVLTHRMPVRSTGGSTLRAKKEVAAAAAPPAKEPGRELTRQEVDAAILAALRTGWALLQRVAADWTGEARPSEAAERTVVAAAAAEPVIEVEPVSEEPAVVVYAEAQDEEEAAVVTPSALLLSGPPAEAALPVWLPPPGMSSPVAASLTAVRRAAREAVAARERMLTTASYGADLALQPAAEDSLALAGMQEPMALLKAAEEAAAAATVLYLTAVTDEPALPELPWEEGEQQDDSPAAAVVDVEVEAGVEWIEAPAWDARRRPSPEAKRLPPVLFTSAQLLGLPDVDVDPPAPVLEVPAAMPPAATAEEEQAPLPVMATPVAIDITPVVEVAPLPVPVPPAAPAEVVEEEAPAPLPDMATPVVAIHTTPVAPVAVAEPLLVAVRHDAAPMTWRAELQREEEEVAATPRPTMPPRGPSKHALAAAARAQHKASRRAAAAKTAVPVAWRQGASPVHAQVGNTRGGEDDRVAAHRALKWLARVDEQEAPGSVAPGSFALSDGYDGASSESDVAVRKLGGLRDSRLDFGGAPPSAR